MGRTKIILLIATMAVASSAAASSPSQARAARFIPDCYEQEILIPIPRDEAQSYLPDGFSPTTGAASQEHVVYLSFTSISCGDVAAPSLELALLHMSVSPPEEYRGETRSHDFIIEAVGAGAGARSLEKKLCLSDVFKNGDIASTQQVDSEGALSRGTTEISSKVVSATMSVDTTELLSSGGGQARWFFKDGRKIGYFDRGLQLGFLGMGTANVVYEGSYRDRPPVETGVGVYSFHEQTMYAPSTACSQVR